MSHLLEVISWAAAAAAAVSSGRTGDRLLADTLGKWRTELALLIGVYLFGLYE